LAVSDVYNTIHFATPLIELPIDKVTQSEAKEYDRFATTIQALRTYFDPVGIPAVAECEKVRRRYTSCPWPPANSTRRCGN